MRSDIRRSPGRSGHGIPSDSFHSPQGPVTPMKRRSRAALVVLVAALLSACGGSTSPQQLTVDGNWLGTTGGQTLSISLASSGQSVSGTGTISAAGSASYPVTISGTFVVPTLAVAMTSAQHPSTSLAATLGGGVLAGALNGNGFADAAIVLNRQ